jgi:transcriptional regulator with XRE-family HTH domain
MIKDIEKYPFKQRLIMLRTAKGLSQQELSADINANASSIGAWERGESIPKGDKLHQLADALGIDHEVLVRWRIEETIKRKERETK